MQFELDLFCHIEIELQKIELQHTHTHTNMYMYICMYVSMLLNADLNAIWIGFVLSYRDRAPGNRAAATHTDKHI